MAIKKITFRVFRIENDKLTGNPQDLIEELCTRLKNSNIKSRIIEPEGGSVTSEVLSFYKSYTSPQEEYFYGVIMRLKPAEEIQALPNDFLNMSKVSEDDLLEIKEIKNKVVCSSLYHFLIIGDILITDLMQINPITCLSKYINKFTLGGNYSFSPYIIHENLKLKDIKKIEVRDNLCNIADVVDQQNKKLPLLKRLTKSVLGYVSPTASLEKILKDKLITAKLILDFSKPKGMTDEDYKRKLGALLAPLNELDSVRFVLSNGLKLDGKELVYNVSRNMNTEEINTESLISEMIDVYKNIPAL